MTNLTPKEISREALIRIKKDPEHYDQTRWHRTHHYCKTTHCYAGFCDLIINEERVKTKYESVSKSARVCGLRVFSWELVNPVQQILGLDRIRWEQITNENNSFYELVSYHRQFFDDQQPF